MPLQCCAGDCDHDGHCAAGFSCHRADGGSVPGCTGTPQPGVDYCAAPLHSEYETVAATATSDRACATHTTCVAGQWQSAVASAGADRECAAPTQCGAAQWQTAAPTLASDRACADHARCSGAQYETKAAGAHHDRACAALTQYGAPQLWLW